MAAIPQPERTTVHAIYDLHSKRAAQEAPRSYLGWSEIGTECDRALWYGFRQAGRKAFEGRMLRLFQTGHMEEARVLAELRDCGFEVWDRDPATGNQFAVSGLGGHLRGHADAIVRGLPEAPLTPHLVDVKTINAKRFAELLKKGMRELYPKYWAQAHGYMGLLELERAMFIFVCKDDDRIHVERFPLDRGEFEKYQARAERIITAATPPQRLSDDPAWFGCKFCDFHALCHGAALPAVNCRTCAHSTPITEGTDAVWTCASVQVDPKGIPNRIPATVMPTGCGGHRFIPILLEKLGTPVDSDGDAVTYQRPDGSTFTNGNAPGFSSAEILLAPDAITDPTVQALKSAFPSARIVA